MLTSMAVPAIWTPLKTKEFTADCLTASEFVCTTKQLVVPAKFSRRPIQLELELAGLSYSSC